MVSIADGLSAIIDTDSWPTIGALWGCSKGTAARQVCRLGAQVGGKIVAEFAFAAERAGALDEAMADARPPLLSRLLHARGCKNKPMHKHTESQLTGRLDDVADTG